MKFSLKHLTCLAVAVVTFLPPAPSALAQKVVRQQLKGHVPAIAAGLQPVGDLAPAQQLSIDIGLPLRNQAELKAFLEDIYDPSSPNYHHYLTAPQFTARFGPSQGDYDSVVAFATAHNLIVSNAPNRMLVSARGSVADIQNAFHITLKQYLHPHEKRNFFAPDTEPSVDIPTPILHISGLDNYYLPRPMNYKKTPITPKDGPPTPFLGSGPGGTYSGYDFRAAYLPGVTLDGSGQNVGLLQFDGYFPNDIASYESQAGLPNIPLVNVFLDGYNGTPGGGNGEVALDIEMCAAMAPGLSSIIIYSAGPFGLGNDILNRMASDNIASQLSSSWSFGVDVLTDQIYQEIIAQGQTFFNASGDFDAWVGEPFPPVADPYLTIVGGTTLSTSGPVGTWQSEIVWNYYNDVGSGGGISGIYSIPSWQQGLDMTNNGGSTVFRNIPDVALTGDNVYSISDNGFGGYTAGTSCASPLWAGVAALINQQAAQAGSPPVGFLNPALYAIGKGPQYGLAFHDIIVGNNTNSVSTNQFFAVPGYDLCTGWGTPAGTNLINILAPPAAIPLPRLVIYTNIVYGGNANGIIDFNECNTMDLILANIGVADATDIRVTISTTTPGVIVAQPVSLFPDIPVGGFGTNVVSFKISTAPEFVCGTPIHLNVRIKSAQQTVNRFLTLPTGVPGAPLRFDNFTPAAIPDVGTTNSVIVVSNVNFTLNHIAVSLFIQHTFDADLVLQLVSPDGTTNTLAANQGFNGQNYGIACSPDSERTTFDDLATNSITSGIPPFIGTFQPQEPLSVFTGKYGTNVNGPWRLIVSDVAPFDVGTLHCWSLLVTPTTCTNGGGECPGADMGIGMRALPEPAIVGNNLTYTLFVTNSGPSHANTVSVSQVLPSSMIFVSGSASQGAVVANSGIVTANLGPMAGGATATISVTVLPVVAGVFTTTATVSSDQPDFNPANNSVTLLNHVSLPTADLAVGLFAAPNSTIIGGNLTYTVSVTNNGPSAASGIMVTNIYPPGVALLNATVSQGTLYVTNVSTVICSFGSLAQGAVATATVTARAIATGTLVASAQVGSTNPNEVDPNSANNFVIAPVAVGSATDLALGLVAYPNPDVVTSNLTLITTVTNFGPSQATGVVVNETLPTALTNITVAVSPSGTYSLSGTNLVVNLGSMAPGATASITAAGGTLKQGYLSSTATVGGNETDPNLANNSGAVSITVALPFVNIAGAGATLISPATGYLDIGQTNTIQFRLQNVGNVINTNLVATLLSNSSVTPLSGPQTYGILQPIGVPGGIPVSRQFTFISTGVNGGTVSAVLSLRDGTNTNLPPITFTFQLPGITSFSNTAYITIPDPNNMPTFESGPALPYPSTIAVSGLNGQVARVTATLAGLTHAYPHDINALLVGPLGDYTLLLSHAADVSDVAGATVTFDDAAASALPQQGYITTGAWKPSAYPPSPVFSNPAPVGPYTASLSTFAGENATGTWKLFIYDDSTGDAGSISNGWSLGVVTVNPVNQVADLALAGAVSPTPALAGNSLAFTFTITNAGPSSATGVTFSNALPAGLTLLSASSSQGNVSTFGNTVVGNLATLPVGSAATVTVSANPTSAAVGFITNTASVTAFETDLHTADNQVSVVAAVQLPVADLAVGISASATNVLVGSNLVYTLSVTNNGPGTALAAVLTAPLPPQVSFVSAVTSLGSVSVNGGVVVANFGNLGAGLAGSVTLTVVPQAVGLLTNSVSVATSSSDLLLGNNSAEAVVTVNSPAAIVVPAGAALTYQSLQPPNGVVNPGETVTVSLSLVNMGVLNTTNLVATLLETGGVTQPSAPATYGQLLAGGPPVSRSFGFTASSSAASSVVATLQLTDGAFPLGTASFVFNLPVTTTLSSTNAIIIPDHGPGAPYPSVINVGLTGYVTKVTVNLAGVTHSFPSDVNVLVANPAGAQTLLMSHDGSGYSITNVSLTFDDTAAFSLPVSALITNGTYLPSRFGAPVLFPGPALPGPYAATLSALDNIPAAGPWSLYVLDDSPGDSGVISSGWSLNLSTINPATPLADLAASMTAPASVGLGSLLTFNITVNNNGPATAPAVFVTDTLPGTFFLVTNNASVGTVFNSSGALSWVVGDVAAGTSATLSLTVLPLATGDYLNSAQVAGNFTDLNQANNSAQTLVHVTAATSTTLSGAVTNGVFLLTVQGQPGATYQIQASTNLTTWVSLGNFTATNGVIQFQDPAGLRTRYYRTLLQ
ncbi:MAG TPA: protease pro-enzyme activation domain-containing protein [Verrucomicrobiae bacterium]|nr:protease pro-enzyme activation domain-containing protein [Verrucomicrobiae bacterium]